MQKCKENIRKGLGGEIIEPETLWLKHLTFISLRALQESSHIKKLALCHMNKVV